MFKLKIGIFIINEQKPFIIKKNNFESTTLVI